MSSPKAPEAPDPVKTAAAQTGTNVSTAIANAALGNVNQITPDGSLTYSQTGTKSIYDPSTKQKYDVPTYTATTALSAANQALKNTNDQTQQNLADLGKSQSARLQGLLGTPFTLDGLPAAADPNKLNAPTYQGLRSNAGLQSSFANAGDITKTYGTDFSGDRSKVEDALFSRLNPQIDQQRSQLEASLANKGIRVGSAAYNSSMDDFNRGINDQRTSVLLAGGQEQSRLAGLEAQRAQFQNSAQAQQYAQNQGAAEFGNSVNQQAFQNANASTDYGNSLSDRYYNNQIAQQNAQNQSRATALNEQFALRNQPLNEISSLLSGSQVSSPNFVSTNMPTIPTTDYAGIVQQDYANRVGAYNTQLAQRNSTLGGLFGLGASIGLAPISGGGSLFGKLFS